MPPSKVRPQCKAKVCLNLANMSFEPKEYQSIGLRLFIISACAIYTVTHAYGIHSCAIYKLPKVLHFSAFNFNYSSHGASYIAIHSVE